MILSFILIPTFFLVAAVTMTGRRKRARTAAELELSWEEITLFERHGEESVSGRMDSALILGCEKLGLDGAVVAIQDGDIFRVQSSVSVGDAPAAFVVGQILPKDLVFCGMMNGRRAMIAIDYAGISEWRHHRAHRELGWESYVGVRKELSTGEGITIAFHHSRPREQLFSAAEKKLVGQLGGWIAAIFERERDASSTGKYPEAVEARA